MSVDSAAERALVGAASPARSRLAAWLGENGLLVAIVCSFAALLFIALNRLISTDGWLALVAGRLIAERGLPSEDTLTVTAAGRPWIDQQWLAQLAFYGLERAGGLGLLLVVHAALVVAGFAGAIVLARRRGGSPGTVAAVSVVALLPYVLTTHTVRAQSLAYVGFVLLLAILTTRAPLSRRNAVVALVLVALWANLHGSVLVAAMLVSLRGVVDLVGGRRDLPSWLLAVAPWGCVLASPYATSLPEYYASTAFNESFGTYLAQWQPTTLSPVSAPLILLVLTFVWLLGRSGCAYSPYEKLSGAALLVLALLAVRHWPWFSLFAVAFIPRGLRRERDEPQARGVARINIVLAAAAVGLFVLAAVSTAGRPASWLAESFPPAGARAVASFTREHPDATVYATVRYADWLLWELPWLEGRLAYDARFELLERDELERNVLFRADPIFVPQILRSNEVVVVDRVNEQRVLAALESQTRPVYSGRRLLVLAAEKEGP